MQIRSVYVMGVQTVGTVASFVSGSREAGTLILKNIQEKRHFYLYRSSS
jgi:hypothetical protein